MDPIGLGRDVVLRVVEVAGPITWVEGDAIEDPAPWPTDDLVVLPKREGLARHMDGLAARVQKIIGGSRTAGVLDALDKIMAGLQSIAPEVHDVGSDPLLLTYKQMVGIIADVRQDPRFVPHETGQELERGSSYVGSRDKCY